MRTELRWLKPGLGVKRWVLVVLAGTTLLSVGIAFLLLDFYRTAPETWWLPLLSMASLRFLDRILRALIFGSLGIGLIIWGIWEINRSLLKPFVPRGQRLIDAVSAYHRRERGPRVVVVGGGNGLSSLLRGLKMHTTNLTAIVTVADDGGSSGELRRNMGILPPGDLRNCLTALSNDEDLMSKIFQYRFASDTGLKGHSLGNLFITALADITGSFESAIAESGRVLAVQGRVLPATLHDVHLMADISVPEGVVRVSGESMIPQAHGKVNRVWLEPNNPLAYPPSIQALLSADLIIIGPGSLYTSLLPNLLVPDLAEALRASRALKFYVCNVATQPGETDGYSSGDHVKTIEKHMQGRVFDLIVCNNRKDLVLPEGVTPVFLDDEISRSYALYATDLVDDLNPWRHDSNKLAQAIMDIYYEKTGPLSLKDN
ncbi:MAG: uridine diphosphate-N-acetylglucosamine-binding protein YvcK [Anaerolineae bacterium]|nr:uridine diphosphate-N-acetylglucosamine-binding protein YvcK [Anaerolineae bacterium]